MVAVDGKYGASMAYCTKVESRFCGPYYITESVVYDGADIIKKENLWPWQKNVLEMVERYKTNAINKNYDDRCVHVFVDTLGGMGKSCFCKYLDFHEIAQVSFFLMLIIEFVIKIKNQTFLD